MVSSAAIRESANRRREEEGDVSAGGGSAFVGSIADEMRVHNMKYGSFDELLLVVWRGEIKKPRRVTGLYISLVWLFICEEE